MEKVDSKSRKMFITDSIYNKLTSLSLIQQKKEKILQMTALIVECQTIAQILAASYKIADACGACHVISTGIIMI